jgi:hypothetical protein
MGVRGGRADLILERRDISGGFEIRACTDALYTALKTQLWHPPLGDADHHGLRVRSIVFGWFVILAGTVIAIGILALAVVIPALLHLLRWRQ